MEVCKQCGVELEKGMEICPLCETPVSDGRSVEEKDPKREIANQAPKPKMLKHILWQIACVLLLSGTLATLIVNLSIVGHVTWSVYPVTICLILLSYASLVGLWETKLVIQVIVGWMVSSAVLGIVQLYSGEDWPLSLAFPILIAINAICVVLILILGGLKVKGLNILAILLVGVAVLCLAIDGILSLYLYDQFQLSWSVVVSACILPVTAAIVFMYFRTRSNSDLQKIFHT